MLPHKLRNKNVTTIEKLQCVKLHKLEQLQGQSCAAAATATTTATVAIANCNVRPLQQFVLQLTTT